ncbi:MAG: hypothetical protein FRX49_00666 [Trebouxia sp. A1-2]|nr:MAG: hypothetical protein FRX49_00666 [Trebouxia sp. A1-2]
MSIKGAKGTASMPGHPKLPLAHRHPAGTSTQGIDPLTPVWRARDVATKVWLREATNFAMTSATFQHRGCAGRLANVRKSVSAGITFWQHGPHVTTPATAAICTAALPNSMESRGKATVLTRPPTEQPVHEVELWKDLSFFVSAQGLCKRTGQSAHLTAELSEQDDALVL